MDDFDAWRAQRRRERETEMYDEPVRDEWSLVLDMSQPFLLAVIVVALVLAILYATT